MQSSPANERLGEGPYISVSLVAFATLRHGLRIPIFSPCPLPCKTAAPLPQMSLKTAFFWVASIAACAAASRATGIRYGEQDT
jgi:hypothetical protein